jgi:alkane 1-monooxygenase
MKTPIFRSYAAHGLAFVMPLYTLAWGLTGPHPHPELWLIPLLVAIVLDFVAGPVRAQPQALDPRPFDAVLLLLTAVQPINVALLLRVIAIAGIGSWDSVLGIVLVGASSGYSAIVVAHELVHRPQAHMQAFGRLLLCTVLYEHFATEHVRGHHKRIGTPDDPATARHGERLWAFVARTVPAQFASAWRLECKRLGDVDMRPWDRRQLRNRVLHGLLVGWGSALALGVTLGTAVFAAFVLQAAVAVLLLETINYIEHWGLARAGKRVTTVDSWDAEGWFTFYSLVGLSRHADHHAHAARPYQQLRWFDESPKMPWGYWATGVTAIFANPVLRRRMDQELRARSLGPYRVTSQGEAESSPLVLADDEKNVDGPF